MPVKTPRQNRTAIAIPHKEEHLACHNYSDDRNTPITIVNLKKGDTHQETLLTNELIYIKEGKVDVVCNLTLKQIKANMHQIFALPIHTIGKATAIEDSQMVIVRLYDVSGLCDRLSFESLNALYESNNIKEKILNTVEPIDEFFDFLTATMESGILCRNYLNMKVTELMFLLRHLYTKEDIAAMLCSVISGDMDFWYFVTKNWSKVNNSQEFAGLLSMTVPSFERKFKAVFGISPKKFIEYNKGLHAKRYLSATRMPVKDISIQLGFEEPNNFARFFKRMYGISPTDFRVKSQILQKEAHTENDR